MAWQLKHRLVCLHERRLCILVRILYLGDVAEKARISSPRIFWDASGLSPRKYFEMASDGRSKQRGWIG